MGAASSGGVLGRLVRRADPKRPLGMVLLTTALIVSLYLHQARILKVVGDLTAVAEKVVDWLQSRNNLPPTRPTGTTTPTAPAGGANKPKVAAAAGQTKSNTTCRPGTSKGQRFQTGSALPLRIHPAGGTLVTIEPGHSVAWFGQAKQEQGAVWYCVTYHGTRGWVSAYYLTAY